ncbi:amylo-alpha-1,6-glucosidase [Brevibacillus brevis]|uniref:amylo-alpha-1,6-glucosidase n=1 Tax=Brevibacillus brevis TaxID=1393 RepID=UPI0025A5B432|nr:trehalase family glycosidase [Brevibacillus brevis]WJQ81513.1 trehalase family glycosidase [Brevibacillus brevis]
MLFDLGMVPFTRYGSYLVLSRLGNAKRKEGLYLRNIRGGDNHDGAIFRIEMVADGLAVPFETEATPTLLRLYGDKGEVKLCMSEPQLVQVRGQGVGLRMVLESTAADYAIQAGAGCWEINHFSTEIRLRVTPLAGSLVVNPAKASREQQVAVTFLPDEETGVLEGVLEEFHTVWKERSYPAFADGWEQVKKEYDDWLERTLSVSEGHGEGLNEARELAAYITWSCVVRPEGYLPRPAMYMSKNWMTNIWSWDHCFNAMALTRANLPLAWDQLMIFIDRQDESGVFPDFINDRYALWNCCKPPIHGWTLRWMLDRNDAITNEMLEEVYEPLCRWTNWWFRYRDDDQDGIPQYNHGYDCGWDNSTIFLEGAPIESPDLPAYLILQMDVLADLANRLGRPEEAARWQEKAEMTLQRLLEKHWNGENFFATHSGSDQPTQGDSLIRYMPLVLGEKLPQHIRAKLIVDLQERFLTENGLATESPASSFYRADGYWLGPIWAPVTMLLVDGLRQAGEVAFSQEIARRFCRMAARSGMAENFDALTGDGLRDRAFTWTSSVFLMLAHEYV